MSTPVPQANPVPAVAPAVDPVGDPTPAAMDGRASGDAVEPAAPTPEPDPEPEAPKLPDGTPILPCAEPPPGMVCIPGGPFVRGTNDDEPANARPQATVWLQTFYLDVHEVTVEQYEACEKGEGVAADGRDRPSAPCDRAGPQYLDFDHPKMPIQGVSWFDSRKYCQVHGKDLPTEAQWEKAARGPDGELYPWGNEPVTCEHAIIKDARGRSCGLPKAKSKPETGRPWDVGSRPVGRYGLYDMMGNSWEWVLDWYSKSYADCGAECEGTDPKGPCGGAESCPRHYMRVVRGGSWYWDASRATGVFRRPHFPANEPFHHFGFRCAATAEQVEVLRGRGK
ncbi:formylglycine-generating enzyme family protein [Paraliomyxa miuraensis]|uniref:formylglycine-generating enzyme family protein n=1 Tax=Paraliomyxa miuraensis TaxID=376150 RepID=UPI0022511FAF|nr:SUMF1/EgtB/PvdO family nonheme iron enzyme [Paraliomyxa miuraensis]MCX4243233.1 formylglycine-generating enzyme family protein [Paraliomyxa miuraensis]